MKELKLLKKKIKWTKSGRIQYPFEGLFETTSRREILEYPNLYNIKKKIKRNKLNYIVGDFQYLSKSLTNFKINNSLENYSICLENFKLKNNKEGKIQMILHFMNHLVRRIYILRILYMNLIVYFKNWYKIKLNYLKNLFNKLNKKIKKKENYIYLYKKYNLLKKFYFKSYLILSDELLKRISLEWNFYIKHMRNLFSYIKTNFNEKGILATLIKRFVMLFRKPKLIFTKRGNLWNKFMKEQKKGIHLVSNYLLLKKKKYNWKLKSGLEETHELKKLNDIRLFLLEKYSLTPKDLEKLLKNKKIKNSRDLFYQLKNQLENVLIDLGYFYVNRKSKQYIENNGVFINGKLIKDPFYEWKCGDILELPLIKKENKLLDLYNYLKILIKNNQLLIGNEILKIYYNYLLKKINKNEINNLIKLTKKKWLKENKNELLNGKNLNKWYLSSYYYNPYKLYESKKEYNLVTSIDDIGNQSNLNFLNMINLINLKKINYWGKVKEKKEINKLETKIKKQWISIYFFYLKSKELKIKWRKLQYIKNSLKKSYELVSKKEMKLHKYIKIAKRNLIKKKLYYKNKIKNSLSAILLKIMFLMIKKKTGKNNLKKAIFIRDKWNRWSVSKYPKEGLKPEDLLEIYITPTNYQSMKLKRRKKFTNPQLGIEKNWYYKSYYLLNLTRKIFNFLLQKTIETTSLVQENSICIMKYNNITYENIENNNNLSDLDLSNIKKYNSSLNLNMNNLWNLS